MQTFAQDVISQSEPPKPPPPPEVRRTVRLYWYQSAGMAVVLSVVALALLGVFGESVSHTTAEGSQLSMRVEYPSRVRYQQFQPLRIWITNRSARQVPVLTLSVDRDYILAFSNVAFTPDAERPFEVNLSDLRPGETRLVVAELRADRYGRHAGSISATAEGTERIQVNVATLVYP